MQKNNNNIDTMKNKIGYISSAITKDENDRIKPELQRLLEAKKWYNNMSLDDIEQYLANEKLQDVILDQRAKIWEIEPKIEMHKKMLTVHNEVKSDLQKILNSDRSHYIQSHIVHRTKNGFILPYSQNFDMVNIHYASHRDDLEMYGRECQEYKIYMLAKEQYPEINPTAWILFTMLYRLNHLDAATFDRIRPYAEMFYPNIPLEKCVDSWWELSDQYPVLVYDKDVTEYKAVQDRLLKRLSEEKNLISHDVFNEYVAKQIHKRPHRQYLKSLIDMYVWDKDVRMSVYDGPRRNTYIWYSTMNEIKELLLAKQD